MCASGHIDKSTGVRCIPLVVVHPELSFEKTDGARDLIIFAIPPVQLRKDLDTLVYLRIRPIAELAVSRRTNQKNINKAADRTTTCRYEIVVFITFIIMLK